MCIDYVHAHGSILYIRQISASSIIFFQNFCLAHAFGRGFFFPSFRCLSVCLSVGQLSVDNGAILWITPQFKKDLYKAIHTK